MEPGTCRPPLRLPTPSEWWERTGATAMWPPSFKAWRPASQREQGPPLLSFQIQFFHGASRRLPVALYPSPPPHVRPRVSSLLGRFPPTAPAAGPLPVPRRSPGTRAGRVRAGREAGVRTPPRAWQGFVPFTSLCKACIVDADAHGSFLSFFFFLI